MGKVELNNEIILLRQSVRQARVCVINKLIREAKKLRGKKGNEKQMEKNKRKADKFLKEVYALKLIKDDDISKFGILQSDKLRDILQDPAADDKKRVMAKVAQYKALSTTIAEFKEKFPDYETCLASNNNKKKRKKKQPINEPPKRGKAKDLQASLESDGEDTHRRVPDPDSEEDASTEPVAPDEEEEEEKEEPPQRMQLRERKRLAPSSEKLSEDSPSGLMAQGTDERPERDKPGAKRPRNVRGAETNGETMSFKVIGEQATVKRFTDILLETDVLNSQDREEPGKVESGTIPRRTDDFFVNPGEEPTETTAANPRPGLRARGEGQHGEGTGNFPRRRSERPERKFSNSTDVRYAGRERRKNYGGSRAPRMPDVSNERKKNKFEGEKKRKAADLGGSGAEWLHPSWAARKKEQEIMKQGFQGKKIVFEED